MVRRCSEEEFDVILSIINDGAQAYQGVIPADRLEDPYMSAEKLRQEIADGVCFWGFEEESGQLTGVMGIQQVLDVTLIRHAYVRTASQHRGIGARLLAHLRTLTERPMLIGTWADAWAIGFYERHGFRVVGVEEKDRLLRLYWKVPERQIETSVVLVDERWGGG